MNLTKILKLAAAFLEGAAISPLFEINPAKPANQKKCANCEDTDEWIGKEFVQKVTHSPDWRHYIGVKLLVK